MGGSKITIADIPFFNHLDAGDIMAVSQHLQALSFAAEDMLFYQGDPPNGLFLVTSGSVKTYVYAPGTTKKVVVKLVKAGDYLGEFGLLDGMPRSASAMVNPSDAFSRICKRSSFSSASLPARRTHQDFSDPRPTRPRN